MATPGKPRQSGILAPGRISSIPTPGRSRASSGVYQHAAPPATDDMSRAFADAIRANDPSQHRLPQSATSASSLSPQSATLPSQTGRRSVASGRPSSSASTSSATGSTYNRASERAKTPISARPPSRPPSRHSDVFGRSTITKAFEVGDNVRIESLGYEGTLRYVGEIEGKSGLWAGVELSGGFAGKGKNNGSVSGHQYFVCPEKCGVFVATTRLSPPTVGPGAIPRPSSVASSRGGRVTPGLSGRITPSFSASSSRPSLSNGRVTPSASGRVTPSFSNGRITPGVTPSASTRPRTLSRPAPKPAVPALADKITAGSRASKYMSMTAKQLSSRDAGNQSPSRRSTQTSPSPVPPSPSHSSRLMSSPTRPTGSPFSTPKPSLGGRIPSMSGTPSLPSSKGRPSISTPRARIPSGVAMPPPASPMSAASRKQEPEGISVSDLQLHGKLLQEKIALLTSSDSSRISPTRPESVASARSTTTEDRDLIAQLQSRLQALEYDNDRLRAAAAATATEVKDAESPSKLEQDLQSERDEATSRVVQLEEQLMNVQDALDARSKQITELEEERQKLVSDLEAQKGEGQTRLDALQQKLDEDAALLKTLRGVIDNKESLVIQSESILKSKEADILQLQSQLEGVMADLEEERKELGTQIDELRLAGQETIALYEERLSTADSQRYELENQIALLEARARASDQPVSPDASSRHVSSATEIDNETLRDQVIHLQKKITTMEDIIEDSRAASEREEAAFRERMKRLKEKEDGMKKELSEGRKEVERMTKSEANARSRVEEIEEALRESTVALENARAEVEALRTELANLDALVGDDGTGDLSSRVAEFTQRAAADRARFDEEITQLQGMLQQARASEQQALRISDTAGVQSQASPQELQELQDAVSDLQDHNNKLRQHNSDLERQLTDMGRELEVRSKELESLKEKTNHVPVTNGVHGSLKRVPSSPSSSKHESLSAAREEITGLKYIVQELQKENVTATQRIQILESENQLLTSEADQLRQEVQILEDNLDNSLVREENASDEKGSGTGSTDSGSLQAMLKEQKTRFEGDLEQLRKRLTETEMKHARTAHDLNKEISELEALVESKIYREDELEQEVERLKDKLARQKKSSKTTNETTEPHRRLSTASTSTMASEMSVGTVCEICERPGHDIFNCDLLKDEGAASGSGAKVGVGELFCEDCENPGHVAADCPHSLDVF